MADRAERPMFVVVPTHTARYLGLVLAGLSRQTRPADAVVVSCDTDDAAIGAEVERASAWFDRPVWWVRRAHHGGERLCQVRNNAVRALVDELGVGEGRLVVLDGDMVATADCLERHESLGRSAPLVYPYRVNLTRGESEALTEERVLAGDLPEVGGARWAELRRRDRRGRRHLWLRRLGLGAAHKPKLLGGHFSCDLGWYLRLNGFDEEYQGWGFKDDEFARRAARLGAGVRVAVGEIVALHLWHETRQPGVRMADLPMARRFARRDLPLVAAHGVRNPLPQHPVERTVFSGGGVDKVGRGG